MRRSRSPRSYRMERPSRDRPYHPQAVSDDNYLQEQHSYRKRPRDERGPSRESSYPGGSRREKSEGRQTRQRKPKDHTWTSPELSFEEAASTKLHRLNADNGNFTEVPIASFDDRATSLPTIDVAVSNNRLDRLEKLVETLMSRRISNSIEGGEAPAAGDTFEFNPCNTSYTTSIWLNKINEECLMSNYDEKNCILFMQSKMSGLMKAWFKTINIYDYSWPELKMLIIRTFPDNNEFAGTLRLLVNRIKQPNEDVVHYYFSKMYLLEACKITGLNAVSCLIDGLNDPYLAREARVQNFLSPETFYSQFLIKLRGSSMEKAVSPPQRDVELYEDQFVDVRDSMRMKRCFTCGKKGHGAADCRHAPVCYKCNKQGHIAAKCTE